MKPKYLARTSAVTLILAMPAAADVIYSNLKNITIPANFSGVYLDVDTGNWNTNINAPQSGWDINPFFGGSVLWNSPGFQPVRSGTGEMDAIMNLAEDTTVGGGSIFSTFVQGPGGENPGGPGYGASETHMGNGVGQFVSGSGGNIGFRMTGGNYGYMRVVLTNNTSGAVIKDWAYDTGGASVQVGAIKQVGQDIILSSGFTLAASSALIDSGGATNLVKNGSGTNILKSNSTYSGTTTINAGTLAVNGSHTAGGDYIVASTGTLKGTGSTASALYVSGVLSPGDAVETFSSGTLNMLANSTFEYQVDSSVALGLGADMQKVSGDLNLAGIVNLTIGDVATTGTAFALGSIFSLINYDGIWNNNLFTFEGNAIADEGTFTAGLNMWRLDYNAATGGSNFAGEYFGGGDRFVNIVAIPEPNVAGLIGGIGVLCLLRRRR